MNINLKVDFKHRLFNYIMVQGSMDQDETEPNKSEIFGSEQDQQEKSQNFGSISDQPLISVFVHDSWWANLNIPKIAHFDIFIVLVAHSEYF